MPLRNAPKRSSVENRLLCYILEFATTENHSKREISMVSRSGCRPSINMKKVGEGVNAVNNSDFFPECNAAVMLQIEARRG